MINATPPVTRKLTGVVIPARERTFADRVLTGRYDFCNDSNFSEQNFPLTLPAGPRDLALVRFGRAVNRKEVEDWATKNGYEVALIDDLLAVGSNSSCLEPEQEFLIAALGSSVVLDGAIRYVPVLIKGAGGRDLQMFVDGDFYDFCLFLVVRRTRFSVEETAQQLLLLAATAWDSRANDRTQARKEIMEIGKSLYEDGGYGRMTAVYKRLRQLGGSLRGCSRDFELLWNSVTGWY